MKTSQSEIRLLPNYFKSIAAILILISILALILIKVFAIQNGITRELTKDVLLVALLVLVISREKIEDELLIKIRIQSLAFAFLFGVISVIVNPVINYFLENAYSSNSSANELIFTMLFFYFLSYYFQKRSR